MMILLTTKIKWCENITHKRYNNIRRCRDGGMADTTDLKSVAQVSVRVQVPPVAQRYNLKNIKNFLTNLLIFEIIYT